jgi:drug/metabolite transporter superfamily protein YnfA
MSRTTAILVLFLAAVLEAGGDAIVRTGIHASGTTKVLLMLAGAVVLFAYGYSVNAPAWDFGKLLGIYVVFFFVVAQIINFFAFRQTPSIAVLIGGLLIISGGAVIALSNR